MAALLKAAPFNRSGEPFCAANRAQRRFRSQRAQQKFSSCKAQYIGEGARAVNDATPAGAIYFVEQYQRFAGRVEFALGIRHGYCPSHSKEKASCAAKSPNP
jgi:hypothetical protein